METLESDTKMPDKTWKQNERRVAKYFSTLRNSLSGGNSKMTRSDTLHNKLFIDCKHTKGKVGLIEKFEKIRPLAEKEGKIPLLAVKSKTRSSTYVLVRIQELLEIAKHAKTKMKNEGQHNGIQR